jgi:hypothetical protein
MKTSSNSSSNGSPSSSASGDSCKRMNRMDDTDLKRSSLKENVNSSDDVQPVLITEVQSIDR